MDINIIKEKEKNIDNCISVLKKEFVGIDKVIDQVIDNIKSWYMFPELNERPVVINLWGMTGCGKTSLVNRICELLDLRSNMVYYNLAKLGEESSSELEDDFERNLNMSAKNTVFVFDEFQFAASISSDKKEKEPKTSLKTIWEIIDTGKIHRETSKYLKRRLNACIRTLEWLDTFGAKIENGVWVNYAECISKMSIEQKSEIYSLYNIPDEVPEAYIDMKPTRYWCELCESNIRNNKDFYLSCDFIGPVYEAAIVLGECDTMHFDYLKQVLFPMTYDELHDYIARLYKKVRNGFDLDYSRSLIFVMGNIDEAYKISYDVDPDMDPDQFHSITEKLSIIDIKEALQDRFRNEQIARLGSIMILYPSFSKKNFEDIISLQLHNYAENVKKTMNIDLEFDGTINDMIYKDGVFPAQGTRPVFASIYEIVQTKLAPIVIESMNKEHYDISKIKMRCLDDVVYAAVYTGNDFCFEMPFKQILRVETLRNNVKKEQQQLTAVHESGHFVIYSQLTGNLPAKLVSVTASSCMNGFMMPDTEDFDNYMTYQDCINAIKVDLAGYAAELIVFGTDNLTSGACEDLRNATTMASRIIREFGMGDKPEIVVSTYLNDYISTDNGMLVKDTQDEHENTNKKIISLLDECVDDVILTLSESVWKDMFVKSCEYLRTNPSIPEEKMREIYESVPKKEREKYARNHNVFTELLTDFINNNSSNN